jgi:hypothetical protein
MPPATLPAAVAIFLIGGIGPNVALALMSIAVLIVGCMLLWRPGESPILLFAFAFPWVQGSIAIFHANWLGISITDYAPLIGDIKAAIVISLAGLATLAAGMRLGAGPQRAQDVLGLREMALSKPMERWFRLYAIAWVTSFFALNFAWVVPGLSQPMLALAAMRWAFFFMLAFAYFVRGPGGGRLFPMVFLFELATSVGGYFSDFKTVFFVTLFAALASRIRLSLRALLGCGALVIAVVALGIVWSSIKGEYRTFVSGGHAQQIVTVDYLTRLGKLADLVGNLDGEALANGADQFLRRVSYVEYFGAVLVYVPTDQPHTQGAILWDSVVRPFMPRMFFADKEVIDDTARTNLYTGGLAGTSEATSISLGYIAEAYIDFGEFGMFAALFAIGVFYGAICRMFLRWKASSGLLGMAVATTVLTSVGAMDNSFTKVFGGVICSLLVAWAMVAFVVPNGAPWLVPNRR